MIDTCLDVATTLIRKDISVQSTDVAAAFHGDRILNATSTTYTGLEMMSFDVLQRGARLSCAERTFLRDTSSDVIPYWRIWLGASKNVKHSPSCIISFLTRLISILLTLRFYFVIPSGALITVQRYLSFLNVEGDNAHKIMST
jgi:hypothetical protein